MVKQRLDAYLAEHKLAPTRSQAENMIRLGEVRINGMIVTKAGMFVGATDTVQVAKKNRYVSRAGQKLASVSELLKLNFEDKIVLDVGSSTGGFTDFALQHGASKIVAIDVGTDQLHSSLKKHQKVELHEKTDIRNVFIIDSLLSSPADSKHVLLQQSPNIVVIDVSFISLREVLPHIATLCSEDTQVVAMVKPQFEAGQRQMNKGVIKNEAVRRTILKHFEIWARQYFVLVDKRDSDIHGAKGNRERFYKLALTKR